MLTWDSAAMCSPTIQSCMRMEDVILCKYQLYAVLDERPLDEHVANTLVQTILAELTRQVLAERAECAVDSAGR